MGLRPGTQLTVDNALKMMMVKSANDMAVVLAEGLGGSIDGFSVMMNDTAKKLGMTQTNYVNPNGLPADGHVTSARDLGILARSFLRTCRNTSISCTSRRSASASASPAISTS